MAEPDQTADDKHRARQALHLGCLLRGLLEAIGLALARRGGGTPGGQVRVTAPERTPTEPEPGHG